MIRAMFGAVFALVFTVGFAGAADGVKNNGKTIKGTVKAVDAEKNTLTVTVAGGEGGQAKDVEFALAGAKITSGKAEVKAADLKVGDTVTLVTSDAAGKVLKTVVVGAVKKGNK